MKKSDLFIVCLLLAFAAFSSSAVLGDEKPPPNIVVILADDMGSDSVSALNPKCGIPTPHLDQLAAEGMRFTDAHSSSAVCSPTRYGLLTGRYNWRSTLKKGIVGRYQPPLIKEDRLTLGGMLQEKGYHTACFGKWHLGWNWRDAKGNFTTAANQVDYARPTSGGPADRGFHYYFGDDVPNWPPYVYFENHRTLGIPSVPKPKSMFGSPGLMMPGWSLEAVLPEITRRCVKYIGERAKEQKPFFLFFPMTSPHTPIAPNEDFKGKSGISLYADFIMETDWCVGQLMEALKKHKLDENTLFIFTADNGTSPQAKFEELEAKNVHLRHSYRGNKADIFEGGHRVPFLVRWPGRIKAGSQSDQIICTTDIMATVADVTGYKLPDHAAEDSQSLWPVLQDKDPGAPLHEAVIHHSISGHFAIRQGPWKLIFARGSAGWSGPRENEAAKKKLPPLQLYHLEKDPLEKQNLQADYPERVEAMTRLLKKLVRQGRSTPGAAQANDGPAWWPQLPWEKTAD